MKKILLLAFMLISFNAFSQFIITGDQIVPYGSNRVYSLTSQNGELYTASAVTWSVSGGTAAIASTNPGNPVTVSTGSPGDFVLTATVQGSCACTNISMPIHVTGAGGIPDYLRISGPGGFCTNTAGNDYTLPFIQGATYDWEMYPSANTSIGNNGTNNIWINVSIAGGYSLSCTVRTSTGQIIYVQEVAVAVVQANHDGSCSAGGGGEESSFIVSPNPGNNEISINTISNTNASATTTDSKFTYKIYDKLGKVVKSGEFSSLSKAVISTTDLPVDSYFVHIFNGKKVIKKQIIIKH